MSIITKSDKSGLHKFFVELQNFKEKYCPDGQTCNDILSISGLVFVCWFMYIEMEPLM